MALPFQSSFLFQDCTVDTVRPAKDKSAEWAKNVGHTVEAQKPCLLMDAIQGITDTDVSMRTRMSSGADPNMQGAERPRCPICIGRYGTQVFAVPSPYINIPPFQDWKDSNDGKDGADIACMPAGNTAI